MRSQDDERTTESRQPTLRALPMIELREARASDVRAGGSLAPRRRVDARPATIPRPKPPITPQRSGLPRMTAAPRDLDAPTPLLTPRPGFATPGRLAIAEVATELHEPPRLDDTPIVAEHAASVRAWVDPASLAPPPWAHVIPPHAAPTSTAAAFRGAPRDPGPTVPIVEIHAPVLRFGPIEKGILILAGFSVVAVIISTLFHAL